MYQEAMYQGRLVCIKQGDGVAIPLDPENTDYQRYLAWVAEGNTPEVIEP